MKYNIALVKGDGIGPDIVSEAVKVLEKTGGKFSHDFVFTETLAGGAAIDEFSIPLPEDTVNTCLSSDAVLLGAVGGPRWDNIESARRPEKALLGLRSKLGLFTNLRPALIYPELSDACPLKNRAIPNGLDILVVRELTGGIYFGKRGRTEDGAYDTMSYSKAEIERVVRKAFEFARMRRRRLHSVDKANVLETSRLWREVVAEVSKDFPDVEVENLYVDNAAMQLVVNPSQFDVIVTENMFGDILSDEASMITGSIGMLGSASMGIGSFGMYEPIHGSAPDIAGKDIANPIATILSASMMLRYSFDLQKEADAIENAVKSAIHDGYRTKDIYTEGTKLVGTKAMGEAIRSYI